MFVSLVNDSDLKNKVISTASKQKAYCSVSYMDGVFYTRLIGY